MHRDDTATGRRAVTNRGVGVVTSAFANSPQISRNSFGPLISARFRRACSCTGIDLSPMPSTARPAISAALRAFHYRSVVWRVGEPTRRGGGWPPGALAYLSVAMPMRLPSAQAQHKAAAQQVYLTRWTVGPVLAFSCQVLTASRRPETPDGKLQKHYFILAIDSTTLWLITILLTTKELGPIAFEVDQRANRCASRRLTRRVHDAKVWQQTPKRRQPAISA